MSTITPPAPLADHPAPAAPPSPATDRDAAFAALLARYRVAAAGRIVRDGCGWAVATASGHRPLLPWRLERRFVELRRLVESRTIEDVSTLRFAAVARPGPAGLAGLLRRELDLCAFITGSEVATVFAVCHGDRAANVVVGLASGVKASVECSVLMPASGRPIDRHEIIARRGVASDRVVDTQVPQASVYAYGPGGEVRYTDTDAELYGLDEDDVAVVRSAFAVLTAAGGTGDWPGRSARLDHQVAAVFESDAGRIRITL